MICFMYNENLKRSKYIHSKYNISGSVYRREIVQLHVITQKLEITYSWLLLEIWIVRLISLLHRTLEKWEASLYINLLQILHWKHELWITDSRNRFFLVHQFKFLMLLHVHTPNRYITLRIYICAIIIMFSTKIKPEEYCAKFVL